MTENRDTRKKETRRTETLSAMRFAGLGMELAGSVLVLAGLGYLADRYFENETAWGVLVGALLGFAFGMFNLFRLVAKINSQDH